MVRYRGMRTVLILIVGMVIGLIAALGAKDLMPAGSISRAEVERDVAKIASEDYRLDVKKIECEARVYPETTYDCYVNEPGGWSEHRFKVTTDEDSVAVTDHHECSMACLD